MHDLRKQIVGYVLIALSVLSVSLAVSYVLARRLQIFVTTPIFRLVEAMRRVREHSDFSVRVTKVDDDELGVLNDGFNTMLGQIEQGRKALQQAHDELEDRVRGELRNSWWPKSRRKQPTAPRVNFRPI